MKIAIRACVPPLTPGHFVAFLASHQCQGFRPGSDDFLATVVEASIEDSQRDPTFAAAIDGKVWGPTRKAIAKLTPKNQFLAMSAMLEIGRVRAPVDPDAGGLSTEWVSRDEIHLDIPSFESHPLIERIGKPFVIDLGTADSLSPVLTVGDPLVTSARLGGFCEQHVGCAAVLVLHD